MRAVSTLQFGLYAPVTEYIERIMARSELRGWGFQGVHADMLRKQLEGRDHLDPHKPIGVTIWRGEDLAYNWNESMVWLEDEAKAQKLDYYQYFEEVSFLTGSESSGGRQLTAVGLDFNLSNPELGLVPDLTLTMQPRWPTLEVFDFLCLNPHLLRLLGTQELPFLMAPGLIVDPVSIPFVRRKTREVRVQQRLSARSWTDTAMVKYRAL